MSDNERRANRARAALNEYAQRDGGPGLTEDEAFITPDEYETALTDLLMDLMHLARKHDLPFEDRLLRIASEHFNEEVLEETGQ